MAETATATVEQTETRGKRKTRIGLVSSDKMEKTIVVSVTTLTQHPLYGRTVKRTTKFKAHDELNEAGVGDTVEIMECRPLSREKRWRLGRVGGKAEQQPGWWGGGGGASRVA